MEKTKHLKHNVKTYLIYTVLFGIVSLIVFGIFILKNKGFIWQADGFKQHFAILYDFNQIMRNIFQNGFPMFSWNLGIGLDVIGQYSYYVIGDPFAYLSLLFPIENLETIYSVLILLRIYCVGLAFLAYCNYQGKERINSLIGAIIYTFCGFILYASIRHPYFTNAAIFLPLTLIGIEKLLKENKKAFSIITVFISAISNYYFFYMIVIIDFIYALIKYLVEYNKGIKYFFYKLFQAVLCYTIGVLMASIVLLPTIYAFLNSARTSFEQDYVYQSNFYKYLFMGFISLRFKNWTVIGISSIILLMLPILFTKLKQKEAKSYLIIWGITTLMIVTPFVASLMNGFNFPYNRWIFAYSFILAYIVTICFDTKYTKKQLLIMLGFLTLYTIIGGIITEFEIKQNLDFYGAIGIAYVLLIIFACNYFVKSNKLLKIMKYAIVFLVIINIGSISLALYSSKGKGYAEEFLDNNSVSNRYATLNGKIDNFKDAIEYIKQTDTSFYRIAKNDTNNQNMSIVYDYNPIQTFLSIGNGYVYELSRQLEDNGYKTPKCINGMDRRTKVTTVLGTKYFICNQKDSACVPYGYEFYHQINDTQIYINKNYLPIGIVYDNYLLESEYQNLNPLIKEELLLSTAVIENEVNNIPKKNMIEINNIKKLDYEIKDGKVKENELVTKKKNESIVVNINEMEPNTELYLSMNNVKYNSGKEDFKITTTFNGVKGSEELLDFVGSAYYMDNKNFLINLGVVSEESNGKLKITFNNKGDYTWDSMEIIAVSMKDYENKINKLKQNAMYNIKYGDNFIEGVVNSKTDGILQISTSFSDGWKVWIDGEESDIIRVNEGLIGTIVDAGEHKIRFEYETPYLKLGIVLSLVGVILFIVFVPVANMLSKKIKS